MTTNYYYDMHFLKKTLFLLLFFSTSSFSNSQLDILDKKLNSDPKKVEIELSKIKEAQLSSVNAIQFNTLLIASYNLQYDYLKSIETIESLPFYTLKTKKDKIQFYYLALNAAWPYKINHQLKQAESWYLKAKKIANELKDNEKKGSVLLQLSALDTARGREVSALVLAKKANKLLINTENKELLADLYNRLGILYYLNNDFPAAITNYQHVLTHSVNTENIHDVIISHYNLGNAYSKWAERSNWPKKESNSAELHYLNALHLSEKKQINELIKDNLLALISYYTKREELKKSTPYVNKLLKLKVNYYGYSQLSKSIILSNYYLSIGDRKKGMTYLESAENYFSDKNKEYAAYALDQLYFISKMYFKLGIHKKAYIFLDQYQCDLILSYKNKVQSEILELKSEIDNQNLKYENISLETNDKKNKLLLIITILMLLLLLGLIYKLNLKRKRLIKISTTDFLTNAKNRRHIFEVGQRDLHKNKFSVMVLDIDHFKNINDSFGHDTGDKVLKVLSDTIKYKIRNNDHFGRIGGEEFLILFSHMDKVQLIDKVQKIQKHVNDIKISTNGITINITASYGIKEYDGSSLSDMIKHADIALYQAKETGRNRYHLYSE